MKTSVLALASMAAAANALLDLDLGADVSLGLKVNIPDGLEVPEGYYPTVGPPEGRTDVYHPAHPGVDIDGCDDYEEEDWHYVHPGTPMYPEQPPAVWTTSTVTEYHTSTIIDCEYDVPDCPAGQTHYTTIEVPATVTICPVVPTEYPEYPEYPEYSETSYYVPPTISESLPVPMETPSWTQPEWTPSSSPCPTTTSAESTWSTWVPPATSTYWSKPPVYTPPAKPSCPGGPNCPPPVYPPASMPHYEPPTWSTTLSTYVPTGTVSVPYAPPVATPSKPVTAGAGQTVQRVGVAMVAGLLAVLV